MRECMSHCAISTSTSTCIISDTHTAVQQSQAAMLRVLQIVVHHLAAPQQFYRAAVSSSLLITSPPLTCAPFYVPCGSVAHHSQPSTTPCPHCHRPLQLLQLIQVIEDISHLFTCTLHLVICRLTCFLPIVSQHQKHPRTETHVTPSSPGSMLSCTPSLARSQHKQRSITQVQDGRNLLGLRRPVGPYRYSSPTLRLSEHYRALQTWHLFKWT